MYQWALLVYIPAIIWHVSIFSGLNNVLVLKEYFCINFIKVKSCMYLKPKSILMVHVIAVLILLVHSQKLAVISTYAEL